MMQGADRHGTAALVLLGLVLTSCAANSSASLEPNATASAAAERRIVPLIHEWFTALEGRALESHTLGRFMAQPSFELSLIGGPVRSLAELEAWRANLHSTHLELVYRIGSVDVETAGKDLYLARFEFERRATDEIGIPHIARREHTWLVRNVPGETPGILRIDERPLLAFPGTGPQIVCY